MKQRLKQSPKRVGVILIATTLLTGCQHLPQGLDQLPFMQSSASDAREITGPITPPAERSWLDIQHDIAQQKAQGHGLVHMPHMQDYLNGLLQRIKVAAGVPEWPGKVYILATSDMNATATGAGNIYISLAWLDNAESEDEIVALLSHEFAHIYLHFDKLNDILPAADTSAAVLSLVGSLALDSAQRQGWNQIDTAMIAYVATKRLTATAWQRSQESAADMLGLNLSLKLGYSYEAGFKTMLERLATWEESQTELEQERARRLRDSIQQAAVQRAREQSSSSNNDLLEQATTEPLAQLSGGLALLTHDGSKALDSIWKTVTSSHPDLIGRLDRLSAAIEELPPDTLNENPTETSWRKAQRHRQTAATRRHYKLAFEALANVEDPKASSLARQSATGVTSTHALPLYAVYQTRKARSKNPAQAGNQASTVLDRNIASPKDRAWVAYVARAKALEQSGQHQAARRIMSQGFEQFEDAPSVWLSFIAFVGKQGDWEESKQLATRCAERFPRERTSCHAAAQTPSELTQQEQKSQAKAQSLFQRILH